MLNRIPLIPSPCGDPLLLVKEVVVASRSLTSRAVLIHILIKIGLEYVEKVLSVDGAKRWWHVSSSWMNFCVHLLNFCCYPSICPHNDSSATTSSLALWDGEIFFSHLSFIRLMTIFYRIFLIIWRNITRRLHSSKHSFSTDLITSHSSTGTYLTSSAAISSRPGARLLFNFRMAISTSSKLVGKLRGRFSPSKVSMVWWFLL